jgi:hypothetical protein
MIRFEEISTEELAKLTEEDIEDLIDLECAEENIRLLPVLPQMVDIDIDMPDVTVYEIPEIQLTNKDDAKKVLDLMNSITSQVTVEWKTSYDHRPIKKTTEILQYRESHRYSQELYSKIADKVTMRETAKKAYNEAKEEYDEIKKQRAGIVEKVMEGINQARLQDQRIANLKREFNRYMVLAENDRHIAWRFLEDSRPDEKEDLYKLKSIIAKEALVGSKHYVNDENTGAGAEPNSPR